MIEKKIIEKKVFEISEDTLKIIKEWYLDQKALLDFGDEIDFELHTIFIKIIENKYIEEEDMKVLAEYLYNSLNSEDSDLISDRNKRESLQIANDLNILDILTQAI